MPDVPPYFRGDVTITYDAEADAAYIYLIAQEQAGNAVLRQTVVENSPADSEIVLDIENGRTLHGIEILGASACLPESLINQLRAAE